MGIFSSIKDAIFGGDDDDDKKGAPKPVAKPAPKAQPTAATGTSATQRPAAPRPMTQVNVEERLDAKPGADKLNWRTSIVDLMKLIGVDSSYDNRKDLAQELGRTDYSGSAEDNLWLHRRTMQELAKSGGRVPKEFLD